MTAIRIQPRKPLFEPPTWLMEFITVVQICVCCAVFCRFGFGRELSVELVYAIINCIAVAIFTELDKH